MMERTSLNVKDKFKQMGGKNHEQRSNELTLIQCLKMLKYIQDYLSTDETPVKLFKYIYRFKDDIEKKNQQLYMLLDQKIKLDDSVKEEKNRLIIKNILKMIVDIDQLKNIVFSEKEISWVHIAEKIKTLSAEDCRNKWLAILNMFNFNKRYQISRDLKMINM
jgi:hypothetical protein